jgi:hypothetical protein
MSNYMMIYSLLGNVMRENALGRSIPDSLFEEFLCLELQGRSVLHALGQIFQGKKTVLLYRNYIVSEAVKSQNLYNKTKDKKYLDRVEAIKITKTWRSNRSIPVYVDDISSPLSRVFVKNLLTNISEQIKVIKNSNDLSRPGTGYGFNPNSFIGKYFQEINRNLTADLVRSVVGQ